jgi:hypothetical protein
MTRKDGWYTNESQYRLTMHLEADGSHRIEQKTKPVWRWQRGQAR